MAGSRTYGGSAYYDSHLPVTRSPFQNMLPWMNQAAVPRWRDSQAAWWFFHGSGANSHTKTFSCKLSPVGQSRWSQSANTSKNGSRLALLKSLETWCIINQIHDHLIVAWKTYQGFPLDGQPIPRHLRGKILYTQLTTRLVDLFTVHYHLHILDKTMDDLEELCYGLLSLDPRQSVQHLDHCFKFLLAKTSFSFIHKSRNKFHH